MCLHGFHVPSVARYGSAAGRASVLYFDRAAFTSTPREPVGIQPDRQTASSPCRSAWYQDEASAIQSCLDFRSSTVAWHKRSVGSVVSGWFNFTTYRTMNLLIVDDEPAARAGLIRLCERAQDMRVVGEAGTGAKAIEAAEALRPDLMLLDADLPDMSGLDVLRTLRRHHKPRTILMTDNVQDA